MDEAVVKIQLAGDGGTAQGGGAPTGTPKAQEDLVAAIEAAGRDVPRREQEPRQPDMMAALNDFQAKMALRQEIAEKMTQSTVLDMMAKLTEFSRDQAAQPPTSDMMKALEPFGGQPLIDVTAEAKNFTDQMDMLKAAMDPNVVAQRAQQEVALAGARQQLADKMAEEMAGLVHTVQQMPRAELFVDLAEEAKQFDLAMAKLQESMDPKVIRQRVEWEQRLEEQRQKYDRARKQEQERQIPPVGGDKKQSPWQQILGLAQSLRGTIGGKFGQLAGSGLDVMSALGKASGAGAGEGAAGALGGIAGPVGIAFAVLTAMKKLSEAINQTISTMGHFAAEMLSPDADPSRYVEQLGTGITSVSDKLFYLSPILGMVGSAFGTMLESLGPIMKALDGMAQRYGAFSPDIMQAQAMADITQLLGDLRRAQEAGPALARYIQQRSELQQRVEDAKVRFMTKLMPLVLRLMEIAEQLLPIVEAFAGVILEGFNIILEPLEAIQELTRQINGSVLDQNQPDLQLPMDAIRNGQTVLPTPTGETPWWMR